MKIAVDLCSGGHGWTSGLDPKKWTVISVEFNEKLDATIHADLTDKMTFVKIQNELRKHNRLFPDLILFSPECKSFSIAGCRAHWTPPPERNPKSLAAVKGLNLVHSGLDIIRMFTDIARPTDEVLWVMENPVGLLRKMECVEKKVNTMGATRHTVAYCQYGHTTQKPTDLWTNISWWKPRPMCKRGSPCHEAAPRGSRSGIQKSMSYLSRSLVPEELSREVGEVCLNTNFGPQWM